MIHGVRVTPLRQIFDERGKVMHMLRDDDQHFEKFGEIYFSCINQGAVKAWHLHSDIALNYAVVSGHIKFVLYDGRSHSNTYGNVDEYYLSPENYCLVHVPPGIWNGFKGISSSPAIVANCATGPHDPAEIRREAFDTSSIPYDWQLKHF